MIRQNRQFHHIMKLTDNRCSAPLLAGYNNTYTLQLSNENQHCSDVTGYCR